MRIHSILLFALLGVPAAGQVTPAGPAAQPPAPANEAAAPRISLLEFKKLHDASGVIVLDVRGAQSYREGHVPGAVSVPLETLGAVAGSWRDAGKPVVAYCS